MTMAHVRFKLTVNSGNDAFQDGNADSEVSRILRLIADRLDVGPSSGIVYDYNGNKVGAFDYDIAED